jgi:O-antigen/teichoic acid export membrane protein
MVAMTLRPINNSVLYAAERFTAATVLTASETVASAIVHLAVAEWLSVDIFWLMVSILAVRVLFLVASFVTMIPGLPGFRLVSGRLSVARDLLSTGFWFLLAGIFGPLLTYFDRLLIGGMVGVGRLPFYTIPQTILQQSSHVPRALGSVLFPRFSAIRDAGEASRLAVTAIQAMAFVAGPICVLLILAMEPILQAWLSSDFAHNSALVAMVLMSSLLPSAMARIVSSQLNGRNRPDLVVKILLLEVVPYGCALYLATREYGLVGVAFVWTFRSSADALLLGAVGRVLLPMLRSCFVPAVLIACALIVGVRWDMNEPQRWIASAGLCVITAAWAICYLPKSLAVRVAHVRVLRWIPVGRFHHVGMH